MRAPLLTAALAPLCPMLWAEPVQVATLPAKIVPTQATTLNLEHGVVSRLADASKRIEAGTIIAVVHEERTAQEREELELKLARETMRLRDELRKLEAQRAKVQFYLNLSPRERRFAKNMGAEDLPPTPDSLRDIDERIDLLKREQVTSPRLMKQEFERNHAKLTLKMPFTGRLQYNFPLPEDPSKPFEYIGLPGRPFASVCDDSDFYITISLSKAELTQLPPENFKVSVALPEGKTLSGTYSHRRVEQGNAGQGDILVYFFRMEEKDKDTAYSMLGSRAKARLVYDAGENVQYVSKMELIAHPDASLCENWEQLVERLYPDHHIILVGERNIVLRPAAKN